MYLMTTARPGIAAKELERQLRVTYKCAWRIAHELRKHMAADYDGPHSGHVELDETYVGGKRTGRRSLGKGASPTASKTSVFGMLQYGGGIRAGTVPDTNKDTLLPYILTNVQRGSIVNTDEHSAYKSLEQAGPYRHFAVNHGRKEYVAGIHHVNGVEGF